ncbi:phosphatase PAP2 family protein [Jatrophihabitans endophyticus]|uniref:phosphatase PAP2 family protein n=1 Tax=Jatrophihabitans endophyticus TaxID=1206085 RepID=UPI0019EF5716|nr:phosphatase PAP2 family protein [Jatrophihabitans endophyticus]MBE7187169.1 phosphatase PAP2 family protein [Jatrophihabitans endophyticus]
MSSVPIPRMPRRIRALPMWLRELVLVGALYGFYELVRGIHHSPVAVALDNGRDILNWERSLHLDPESWLTRGLEHVTPLAVPCAYFYSTMHYIITPVVLVWMFRRHREAYRTARTALAIGTSIGLVLFWLVPTAPPRLLSGDHVPDVLFALRHWGWWGGDGSVPRGLGGITNQLAAMPSLHVGWALWSGFLIARYARRRWVRVLGALYPVATTLIVLATGNHYLLDVVAGMAAVALGALGALALRRLTRTMRAARRARSSSRVPDVQATGAPAGDVLGQPAPGELVTASRGA